MIQDRDLNRLLNQARVKLPGSSDAGLKAELWDTLDEFIGDSNCWQEWITVNVVPNEQDYMITPAHGGMILRLVAVFDPNRIGLPSVMQHVFPPSAKLHLVWPQNINMTAKAHVVKNIILPNTKDEVPDAPDWLLPLYTLRVEDGLVGRMMAQPGKSYSNDKRSDYHLKRFRDGIVIAKTAAMRANLFGGQSWRYPGNFRTTTQRGGVSTPFPTDQGWGN